MVSKKEKLRIALKRAEEAARVATKAAKEAKRAAREAQLAEENIRIYQDSMQVISDDYQKRLKLFTRKAVKKAIKRNKAKKKFKTP